MNSKQGKFILFIVGIIVIVVAIGFATNKSSSAPSKYSGLVSALKAGGAQMYGAFWCPHCAAQEADLQMTRPQLIAAGLYNECSNADKSQTPICVTNKVESYPTWKFANGITLVSTGDPVVCKPNATSGPLPGEPTICSQIASQYYKTWLFPNYQFSIKSPTDPVHTGTTWKFGGDAETTGELPLDFLASEVGYTLPK